MGEVTLGQADQAALARRIALLRDSQHLLWRAAMDALTTGDFRYYELFDRGARELQGEIDLLEKRIRSAVASAPAPAPASMGRHAPEGRNMNNGFWLAQAQAPAPSAMRTEELCALADQAASDFSSLESITQKLADGDYSPTADEMASLQFLYGSLADIAQLVRFLRESCSNKAAVSVAAPNVDLLSRLHTTVVAIKERTQLSWTTVGIAVLAGAATVGALYLLFRPSEKGLSPEEAAAREAQRAQKAADKAKAAAESARKRAEQKLRAAEEKAGRARTAKQRADAEKAKAEAERAAVERARADVRAAAERAGAAAARSEAPRASIYALPAPAHRN